MTDTPTCPSCGTLTDAGTIHTCNPLGFYPDTPITGGDNG